MKQKAAKKTETEQDLRVLPLNVMRGILENMSVEDHMEFRAVCRYAHEEVESYWRSQRVISIPKLLIWFPKLPEWKLTSLSTLLKDLSKVFNLFKHGNLRKLSLHGVQHVNLKSLVKCVESSTAITAVDFFANVRELDLRGCSLPPAHFQMMGDLFPSIHTMFLTPNSIVVPKQKKHNYTRTKAEISHHTDICSRAKHTEAGKVTGVDCLMVDFVREHLSNVRHLFVDMN